MFTQQFGDALMELDVVIHILTPAFMVAISASCSSFTSFTAVRSRCRFLPTRYESGQPHTVIFGPGIQQEAAHLFRRLMSSLV